MRIEDKPIFTRAKSLDEIFFGASIAALLVLNLAPMPYSLIFTVPIVFFVMRVLVNFAFRADHRQRVWRSIVNPTGWSVILVLLIASMVYALTRSSVQFRGMTYIELATGIACLGLSIWADANLRLDGLSRARTIYCCAVIVVAVSSVFGLIAIAKYVGLLHGHVWQMIDLQPGEVYPWGTSLRLDSNLFTVPFIASFIFLAAFVTSKEGRSWQVIVLAGLLAALDLYVGVNAASRRFVMFAAIGGGLVLLTSLAFGSWLRLAYVLRVIIFALTIVIGYAAIVSSVEFLTTSSPSIAVTSHRFIMFAAMGGGLVLLTSLIFSLWLRLTFISRVVVLVLMIIIGYAAFVSGVEFLNSSPLGGQGVDHLITEESPNKDDALTIVSGNARLSSIVDGSLFDTRLEYWREAIDLLKEGAWLFGMGYDYQREIACRVTTCDTFDYPHSFFLSHFLASGVMGLVIITAAFAVILARAAGELLSTRPLDRAIGIIIISIAGYALFSGDTIFSLPALCALPALASVSRWSRRQSTAS